MTTPIQLDPTDSRPIWRQIETGIEHLVASGALPAGSPIPSVREMARSLRVNPATVSKAYRRLVDQRTLVVRRGEGTFVAERSSDERLAARLRLLADAAGHYAALGKTLGYGHEEVLVALNGAWDDSHRGEGSES